jgi:hypothetical protein
MHPGLAKVHKGVTPAGLVPREPGEDHGHVGVGGVGDPGLLPVDDVAVAVPAHRRGVGAGVTARGQLHHRKTGQPLAAEQGVEQPAMVGEVAVHVDQLGADQR